MESPRLIMKSLKDILTEGIFSPDLEQNVEGSVYVADFLNLAKELEQKTHDIARRKYKDALGKTLNVGDVVIGTDAGTIFFGQIFYIDDTGQRISVGLSSTDNLTRSGKYITTGFCWDYIKCDAKVAYEFLKSTLKLK